MLVTEPAYRDAYTSALAYDPSSLRFRDEGDIERFTALHVRLRSYDVPDDLKNPDSIVHRMHRMLAHRPLLAPNAADLTAIRIALAAHQPRVEVAATTVVRAMRAALAPQA